MSDQQGMESAKILVAKERTVTALVATAKGAAIERVFQQCYGRDTMVR